MITLVSRHHGLRFVHVWSAEQHVDCLTKPLHMLFICAGIYIGGITGCLVGWSEDAFSLFKYSPCSTSYTAYRASAFPIELPDVVLERIGGLRLAKASVSVRKLVSRHHGLRFMSTVGRAACRFCHQPVYVSAYFPGKFGGLFSWKDGFSQLEACALQYLLSTANRASVVAIHYRTLRRLARFDIGAGARLAIGVTSGIRNYIGIASSRVLVRPPTIGRAAYPLAHQTVAHYVHLFGEYFWVILGIGWPERRRFLYLQERILLYLLDNLQG